MMRPRSHTKAPSRTPAAVYVVTTGLVAPPVTGTILRSSRTSATGPPYGAHATLRRTLSV